MIDICRTLPTFEKTDLGHVRQQSVKKFLIEHVVNVKTINDDFFFIFFIEIENFRGEG